MSGTITLLGLVLMAATATGGAAGAAAFVTQNTGSAGAQPRVVLQDCNRDRSSCRSVGRFANERLCMRRRASYAALNADRDIACRPAD